MSRRAPDWPRSNLDATFWPLGHTGGSYRVKIGFVDQNCSQDGGAERYYLSVLQCARDLGHDAFVVHARKAGRRPLGREVHAYRIQFLEEVAPFQRDEEAEVRTRLGRVLEAERPDALYVQNIRNPATIETCIDHAPTFRFVHDPSLVCLRHWKLLPDVETLCHDPVGPACVGNGCLAGYPYPAPESLAMKGREIEAHRGLSGLVVGSRFMRDLLVQNGIDPGAIHVLPCPLTLPHRALDTARLAGGNRRIREILFVGHLHPIKGLQHLLRALGRATAGAGPWRLTVAGTGSHEKRFRALAREMGIARRVRFLGKVAPEKMPRVYRKADLVVVPSHWPEPYGMVGPEAMANGVPVVAFDTGGIREWCDGGEAGILVRRGDTEALAGVLRRAIEGSIDFAPFIRRAHELATANPVDLHTRALVSLFEGRSGRPRGASARP